MSLQLQVRDSDSAIVGWSKTTAALTNAGGFTYVVVAQSVIDDYEAQLGAMRADGRGDRPTWSGSAVATPADPRQRVNITLSKTEIDADGVDSATITFTLVNALGQTINFTGTRFLQFPPLGPEGREWFVKIVATAGIATKAFKTTVPGDYTLRSFHRGADVNGVIKTLKVVNGPVTISAYA